MGNLAGTQAVLYGAVSRDISAALQQVKTRSFGLVWLRKPHDFVVVGIVAYVERRTEMRALFWMMLACDTETTAAPPDQPSEVVEPQLDVVDDENSSEQVVARHILIAYKDAAQSSSSLSYDEAKAFAEELHQQLMTDPTRFHDLAVQHSTGPSSELGGHLGAFSRGVMAPPFEQAAFQLELNEISPPVETDFGFHLIQRLPLEEICVSQIILAWKDDESQERSEEDTVALLETARERLQSGEDFSDVARDVSEGPYASRGGDLGCFQKGQMLPVFETAAVALKPGEVSEIISSQHGFHVIARNASPSEEGAP